MRFVAACTFLLLLAPFHTLTIEAQAQGSDEDASDLRPGQYIWHPELAPSGEMSVLIDLSKQRAYVRRDGACIGVTTISTGKRGYETPTGDYTVMEMQRYHRSNRYNNAPMPYMQRLTEYGMAMHGGHLPGYPASHGCIRLPFAFARELFKESYVGVRVTITDEAQSGEYGNSSDTSDAHAGLQSCEPDDSPY
jgi:L,D-transpeptidase catalytic domain